MTGHDWSYDRSRFLPMPQVSSFRLLTSNSRAKYDPDVTVVFVEIAPFHRRCHRRAGLCVDFVFGSVQAREENEAGHGKSIPEVVSQVIPPFGKIG